MLKPLGDIINESLPLVEKQTGEAYGKYQIEEFLRFRNSQLDIESDCMPKIVRDWAIDDTSLTLIEFSYPDMHSRAFKFDGRDDLEARMAGPSSFFNPFVTFVIPILKGQVRSFDVISGTGAKLTKDDLVALTEAQSFSDARICWD